VRTPRAFISGARPGTAFEVGGETFHHVIRVLRRAPGDRLVVFDGAGGVFGATIAAVDSEKGSMLVAIEEAVADPLPGIAPLAVGLGLPKGDGFETALRWGSEMGLARIIPVLSVRSAVKLSPGEEDNRGKLDRWRRIARESAEQCRRPAPVRVDPPARFADLLESPGGWASKWIAVPGGPDLAGCGLLEDLGARTEAPEGAGEGGLALVLVGPEGGFDPEEIVRAAEAGFRPVGFPTPVLKAPTAVAYLAALAGLRKFPSNSA
jgi:16S rRNA (uracil1498-N3)-methyltransferase